MQNKIIQRRYGIYLLLGFYFLLLMHVYWPNRGGSGFYLPGNMSSLTVFAVLTLFLSLRIKFCLFYSACFRWLAAGSVILFLPIIWTPEPYISEVQPRLLGLLTGIMVYISLLQWRIDRVDRKIIILIMLSACFIQGILGVAQYFEMVNGTGYEGVNYRPFGVFQQVNVMATFMATGLALALYLYAAGKKLPFWLTGLICTCLIMFPFLIVVTGSRIGMLAAILLSPLQWLILWQYYRRRAFCGAILMLLGAGAACLLNSWDSDARDIASMSTVNCRLMYWKIALRMIAESPWIGWGYGHFQHDFLHYFYTNLPGFTESVLLTHPHNEVLYWGVEGGLMAVGGCGLMVISLLALSRRLFRAGIRLKLCTSPLLAAVPILLHMLVEYPLYLSAPHALVLLLIMRVSDVRKERIIISRLSFLIIRGLSLPTCLVVVFYMLNGMYAANVISRAEKNGLADTSDIKSLWHPHPWEIREEYDVKLSDLLNYKKYHDNKIMSDYLQWGMKEITIRPEANIYINLVIINKFQGNNKNAYKLWREGKSLFPADKRW